MADGFQLPLLLLAGFRTIIDALHAELARQGHPEMRPVHGMAMQAIGRGGTSASEIGRRLAVSKQAAGKTVDRLIDLGYAERVDDPGDGRRKLVRLTAAGIDALTRSAVIFDRLRDEWVAELGADRVADLEDALRTVVGRQVPFDIDTVGWLGAGEAG